MSDIVDDDIVENLKESDTELDYLDSLLDELLRETIPATDPRNNIIRIVFDYFRLAQTEAVDYLDNERYKDHPKYAGKKTKKFIKDIVFATNAFLGGKDINDIDSKEKPKIGFEIGQLYEILSSALMTAITSDPFYEYSVEVKGGDTDTRTLPAENTKEIRKLCLVIGKEVSEAYKKNEEHIITRYLSAIKGIFDNANRIRFDESIHMATYLASRLRYVQHHIASFENKVKELKLIEESLSTIGTG